MQGISRFSHPVMKVFEVLDTATFSLAANTDIIYRQEMLTHEQRTALVSVFFSGTHTDELRVEVYGNLDVTSSSSTTAVDSDDVLLHTFAATTDGGTLPDAAVVTLFPIIKIRVFNTDGSDAVSSVTAKILIGE